VVPFGTTLPFVVVESSLAKMLAKLRVEDASYLKQYKVE